MSYVDAFFDRSNDTIHIVERVDGERKFISYPTEYTFYYDDPKGKYQTIYGTPVTKFTTKSSKAFQKELKLHHKDKLWESDFNPIFRCLSTHYLGAEPPKLNVAFFDIEADFDPDRGYAQPDDPFCAITAITVHLQWLDRLVTLALKPKTITMKTATEIGDQFDDTFVFDNEIEMLDTFLDLIEDADVLSGWNSEGYDIPYTVNRIIRIMSKEHAKRLCLWNKMPSKRTFERFGKENETYDLVGRIHADYMQLYIKYTYEEKHSYSLDAIGEIEVEEHKVPYEGSLDKLYNYDFKKFIEYSRQDVALIDKIDQKLKYLDLSNQLAHENTVLFSTTAGTVALTEQAIINHAHSMDLIVPNRRKHEEQMHGAAGAYVAYPVTGLHSFIGGIDINSLYPSAIRSLNMAPETIVGQLRPTYTETYLENKVNLEKKSYTAAWEGLFGTLEFEAVMEQKDSVITVDWEDGSSDDLTGKEIYQLIYGNNQPWCLSANGTIFRTDKVGVIPDLLGTWYRERQQLQAKLDRATTEEDKEFWDKRQLVKKINLNALYGAILNIGCRFFDKRIGQSTTLTGRRITYHMASFVNEAVTGEYNHVGKSIIYGDTDSVYFSAWPMLKEHQPNWSVDSCIELYDAVADALNESFPGFMEKTFHVPRENGEVIRAGREIVASKGLFITKKRYGLMLVDKEGKRLDVNGKPGKLKAMGLDLRRSDTQKIVQDFLKDLLIGVLCDIGEEGAVKKIKAFKREFAKLKPWEKGTPKRVNKLTKFTAMEDSGKANLPGHVRAAYNWNKLKAMHSDNYSQAIMDGQKTIMCTLKSNPLGINKVAYPIDESRLPDWFKELPFDELDMEQTNLTQKVHNLLKPLDWDLDAADIRHDNFNALFE